MDRRACTRRSVKPCYFVPEDDGLVLELPLGVLDGDPEEVVSLEELGVLGDAVGGGVVGGEAAGVRSAGRSPTRPVPLSEQAVARVATSASAEKPSNAFFMAGPSRLDSPERELATEVPLNKRWCQCGIFLRRVLRRMLSIHDTEDWPR
jgi:hypothetical protein